jgi:hypothetical protein
MLDPPNQSEMACVTTLSSVVSWCGVAGMNKIVIILISSFMCLCFQLSVAANALAAKDGIYRLSEVSAVWDGTDAKRLSPASSDFGCSNGD